MKFPPIISSHGEISNNVNDNSVENNVNVSIKFLLI
ncbi:hypothetical protein G4B88_030783 [Cannabis sativa]|uniref:Uncharacterized protein n=1 Tax=Cannabis sativa TaxID=3483 RepID=A0A7J6H8N2_CANSA|nr:hypothetical protein G4B88_030783 [Cannabis sativa]